MTDRPKVVPSPANTAPPLFSSRPRSGTPAKRLGPTNRRLVPRRYGDHGGARRRLAV